MIKFWFFAKIHFFVKDSPGPCHFFEINVGKRRIQDTRTTLKLNDVIFNRFCVDLEIQFLSRSMSDPPLSDIDFKDKMDWVWTTLKMIILSFSQKSFSGHESDFPRKWRFKLREFRGIFVGFLWELDDKPWFLVENHKL